MSTTGPRRSDAAVAMFCGVAVAVVIGAAVYANEMAGVAEAKHQQGWMILTLPLGLAFGGVYGVMAGVIALVPAMVCGVATGGRRGPVFTGFGIGGVLTALAWCGEGRETATLLESLPHTVAVLGPIAAITGAFVYCLMAMSVRPTAGA